MWRHINIFKTKKKKITNKEKRKKRNVQREQDIDCLGLGGAAQPRSEPDEGPREPFL